MGQSFYKLSDLSQDVNYDHKCREWYSNKDYDEDPLTDTLSCPCNMAMAAADARWRHDGVKYPDNKTCLYERIPAVTSVQVGDNCSRAVLYLRWRRVLDHRPLVLGKEFRQ